MQLRGSVAAMWCSQQTLWLFGTYASLLARRTRPACGLELPAAPGLQGVYPLRGTYRLRATPTGLKATYRLRAVCRWRHPPSRRGKRQSSALLERAVPSFEPCPLSEKPALLRRGPPAKRSASPRKSCPGSGTASPPLSAARRTRATRPGSDSPTTVVR